jgi:uroporphyrinogen III methyltransferase/synthase
VREVGLSNPSVIVVGDVVGLREKLRFYDRGALFGKRLLLPRPASLARASAKEIRQRGGIAIVTPLIAIDEPEDPLAVDKAVSELASYDWVLLTSANGAERLVESIMRAGRDARAFGQAKIGVIGPKTAAPLQRLGLVPDLVAEEHVAEGLLLALTAQQTMKRVLLFRAAEAREVLPETLRARGVEVDVVAAYRTRRVTGPEVQALRGELAAGHIDAVLVTSSSMAQALGCALGPDAAELLRNTTVASIGPVTTASLEAIGIAVHVVASSYTVTGLLDALERAFAKGAGP